MNDNGKKRRIQILKEIITNSEIEDQKQLLSALKKRGIATTQATISRDLQELRVVKIHLRPGASRYQILPKEVENDLWNQLEKMLQTVVYEIKSTDSLLVIKTLPGNADSVAIVIDKLKQPEILGTIAGDDTILVIVADAKSREKIENQYLTVMKSS